METIALPSPHHREIADNTVPAFEEARTVAMDYGCDDVLRKPFQAQDWLNMTSTYLGINVDQSGPSIPNTAEKTLSVLVAEDHPMNQATMSEISLHLGHAATIAQNGIETVKELQAQPFDLTLMDLHMPQLDGWEAPRRIRHLSSVTQPIIVGATGSATTEASLKPQTGAIRQTP